MYFFARRDKIQENNNVVYKTYTTYREVNVLPNIKSAKKRVKVTESKTLQNQMFKTGFKTTLKKFEKAVEAGDKLSLIHI